MVLLMLIGLTGGIACGKTTVAQMLRERGARIIDADQVARDVVAPGTDGLQAIVSAFGDWVLTEAGALDRPKLGQYVFEHPDERKSLERVVHPLIAEESTRQIQSALLAGGPLVVYDAALLFESGRAEFFRPIVVVYLETSIQEERLMARDELTRVEAQQRITAQMLVAEKAKLADHIIDNGGTFEATETQVDRLWMELTNGC